MISFFHRIASLLAAHRSSPERTNRALLVVLLMECISRVLRRTPPLHAALERSEYARRDKDMVRYLIRGSIWETYTRFVQPISSEVPG